MTTTLHTTIGQAWHALFQDGLPFAAQSKQCIPVVQHGSGHLVPQGPCQEGCIDSCTVVTNVDDVNQDPAAVDPMWVAVVKHGVIQSVSHRHHGDACGTQWAVVRSASSYGDGWLCCNTVSYSTQAEHYKCCEVSWVTCACTRSILLLCFMPWPRL